MRRLWILFVMVGLLAGWPGAGTVQAQVPQHEDAELVFAQAMEAFAAADFGMAFRRFRLVYESYPLHRKTTAAHLMAGKALYREGQYAQAAELLEAFLRKYPTSGYLDEAQRTLDLARHQLEGGQARVVSFGVLLPQTGDNASLTQALFNGIRLAVDEHNAAHPMGPLVRMVFRDSRGTAAGAAAAVRALAEEGVEVIIGPLFSAEARSAGTAAENAGIVLVAPLANDDDVSAGKRFVFQANPTITARGRAIAAYALDVLGMRQFGIVAERDGERIGERMADGFRAAVEEGGGTVLFEEQLSGTRTWSQLDRHIGVDTLGQVEALYVPVSSGRGATLIEGALQELVRAGVAPQVLGNDEWHTFKNRALASRFAATYSNDFNVDSSRADVQAFVSRFEELAGTMPEAGSTRGRLAYTGYDLTRFLLDRLVNGGSTPLLESLRAAPPYQGLGIQIDFAGGNVNQAMYVHRYRDGAVERVK